MWFVVKGILKALGFLLLAALVLLLALLLIPFGYEGAFQDFVYTKSGGLQGLKKNEKTENIETENIETEKKETAKIETALPCLRARLSWLFGALALEVGLQEGEKRCFLRLFGLPLPLFQKQKAEPFGPEGYEGELWGKEQEEEKEDLEEEKENLEKEDLEKEDLEKEDLEKEDLEKKEETTQESEEESDWDQYWDQDWSQDWGPEGQQEDSLPGKLRSVFERVRSVGRTISSLYRLFSPFLESEEGRAGTALIFSATGKVLWHMRPRRLTGHLVFGFEDPSKTGHVLAGAGALYPLYGESLEILPDFEVEELTVEGNLSTAGRVFLIIPLLQLFRIVLNRNIWWLIRRVRHGREE